MIEGWTQGALQMRVGERARVHVPPQLGYGGQTMGTPNGAWYIPANSHLCFDLEITACL
uniref:peptidylprolyl isomerase n=1 Tax=Arcella intermedia TaxID=1963864 RepID=A0A6B2LXJ5_9EUKA